MSAIVRFLLISAAVVIPWGIVIVADLELKIISLLRRVLVSDIVILGLLVLPPLLFFLIRWLLAPRSRQRKRHSENRDIVIKFRG